MILRIICSQFLLYFLVQELEADIFSARCFSLIRLSDYCTLKLFLGEVSGLGLFVFSFCTCSPSSTCQCSVSAMKGMH